MLKAENQEASFMDISFRFSCASTFQALYFLTKKCEKKNLCEENFKICQNPKIFIAHTKKIILMYEKKF